MDAAMPLPLDRLDMVLGPLGLGKVIAQTPMSGGSAPAVRIELSGGMSVVLKIHREDLGTAPGREAFAAALLADSDIPVTRYLLVDDSGEKLPFRFAVTNYQPGVTAGALRDHPDIASLYRQTGQLQRKLHAVTLPAYGAFGPAGIVAPVASNAELVRTRIETGLANFVAMGGDPDLAARLRMVLDERFDAVVPHSRGAVFAHDDLHPNNVLAVEDADGRLVLSGLIDFGNARAADAVSDLAKCLFCSEHDAPGSMPHILAGYGPIDHPDPEAALAYYTTIHRITMWSWLRRIGALPTPDAPTDLIDPLRATAGLQPRETSPC